MSFIHKKIPRTTLIVLAIISLLISRALFTLVNDPEGPNVLIVVVLAAGIFSLLFALRQLHAWR